MDNKEPRNYYLLTNPSFREDWSMTDKSIRLVEVMELKKNQQSVSLFFDVL